MELTEALLKTVKVPVWKNTTVTICQQDKSIEKILTSKPGGERIMQEYEKSKTLTDATRRQMINILAAEMTETHGEWVWILGMAIEDDTKKNCRGKRCLRKQITQTWWARPRKTTLTSDDVPTDEDVEAAIAVLRYSADEDTVRVKMKSTFIYRQAMVNDADKSADVFLVFPRFLDTPGLIEQDFRLMFDEVTSNKFLERWPTTFKRKVMEKSHGLVPTTELLNLMCKR
ncbi:hypothetical protein MHYP_G00363320 [Metynnis hypsauchen]